MAFARASLAGRKESSARSSRVPSGYQGGAFRMTATGWKGGTGEWRSGAKAALADAARIGLELEQEKLVQEAEEKSKVENRG